MNWDAIGAIGEILGALGVVISVVYLAAQIRSGSRSLATTMRDKVMDSLDQWNYQLTADPDFALMFHRGLRDFDALDAKEKARFLHTLYGFFTLFENIYLHFLEGSLETRYWHAKRAVLMVFAATPGARSYLEARQDFFDSRFVAEIFRNTAQAGIAPYVMSDRLSRG